MALPLDDIEDEDADPVIPQGPSIPPAAAASMAASPSPAGMSGGLSPDDLKAAIDKKQQIASIGALGDLLANQKSFGNFYRGSSNPHISVSGALKPQTDAIDADIALKKEAPGLEMQKQKLDKNSDQSAFARSTLKSSLETAKQQGFVDKNFQIPASIENMNAVQIEQFLEKYPLLKKMPELQVAKMKLESSANIANARLGQGGERINIAKDNQAAKAAGQFDTDQIMKDMTARMNQIKMDRHTIMSGGIITPQIADELSKGIANALAGGKGAGFHETDLQRIKSSERTWNEMKQYVLGKPMNALPPEQKQFLIDTLDRLEGGYGYAMQGRAKQLAVGKNYAHNPAANQAIQDKVNSYAPPEQPAIGAPGAEASGAKYNADDKAALDWAKKNPTDKRAIAILNQLSNKAGP